MGLACIVYNPENKSILMSRRLKETGVQIAAPGGHLELFETAASCAIRELEEETALTAHSFLQYGVFNVINQSIGYHYIVYFMCTRYVGGAIVNTEPHKHEDWAWIDRTAFSALYSEGKIFHVYKNVVEEAGSVEAFYDKVDQLLSV